MSGDEALRRWVEAGRKEDPVNATLGLRSKAEDALRTEKNRLVEELKGIVGTGAARQLYPKDWGEFGATAALGVLSGPLSKLAVAPDILAHIGQVTPLLGRLVRVDTQLANLKKARLGQDPDFLRGLANGLVSSFQTPQEAAQWSLPVLGEALAGPAGGIIGTLLSGGVDILKSKDFADAKREITAKIAANEPLTELEQSLLAAEAASRLPSKNIVYQVGEGSTGMRPYMASFGRFYSAAYKGSTALAAKFAK